MSYKLQFAELLPYWNVLLQGLVFTIVLTVVSTVVGIAVGTAGASARTFGPVWLGRVVAVYVELIRNTPFIVQLFFIFFGLPALGLKLSETTAAFLAMVINLGAYSTEIIRAGIEAVPKGHIEAGLSLAMTQMGGAAPHRPEPGIPKNLSGAVVADHHRHAGFGGGVADLGGGPHLCRELRGVAQLPQLRGLSAGGAGLPPARDADAFAACARSAASSSRRGEPCCSSASGTSSPTS